MGLYEWKSCCRWLVLCNKLCRMLTQTSIAQLAVGTYERPNIKIRQLGFLDSARLRMVGWLSLLEIGFLQATNLSMGCSNMLSRRMVVGSNGSIRRTCWKSEWHVSTYPNIFQHPWHTQVYDYNIKIPLRSTFTAVLRRFSASSRSSAISMRQLTTASYFSTFAEFTALNLHTQVI